MTAAKKTTAAPTAAAAPAAPVAADPAKIVESTIANTQEQMEATLKQVQEFGSKNVEGAMVAGKDQLDKLIAQATQSFDEATSFGKENTDAVVTSMSVVAKGSEDLTRTMMGLSQDAIEQNYAMVRKLMGVASMKELVDIANDQMKANYDAMIQQSTQLSEMMVKIANDAVAPINGRFNAAIDKMGKPLAA